MTNNYEFKDEFIPSADWMKFNKVGDAVIGTFVEKFHKDGQDEMPSQTVFVLTNATKVSLGEDGKEIREALEGNINVPIKESNNFVLSRLKGILPGDVIGLKFTQTIEPKKKGLNPAKSIAPYIFGRDEEYLKKAEAKNDELSIEDAPF